MTKNLISVRALEAEGLRGTLGQHVFKMFSGSLVVLKGIRRNNVYYLMGSAVTGLASSEQLDGDSTRLWHEGFGQVGMKGSDQGVSTCDLEPRDICVLVKKKVKFSTIAHHLHSLLDCVHVDIWGPIRLHHLEAIGTLSLL